MAKLSKKQKKIVNAPLESFSIQACAGSGKTRTAVARVQKIRELLGDKRTHVLLLSFSNVAVQAFKEAFSKQAGAQVGNLVNSRISIVTFDSFLTSNILRPHAYRTMECNRTPFLVNGSEPFLLNDDYIFWYESSPRNIPIRGSDLSNLKVSVEDSKFKFYYDFHGNHRPINNGPKAAAAIGKIGGYTHELAKYWSIKTLSKEPKLLDILAKRYSHIVVDEAQDLGSFYCRILQALINRGATVSLVGDPSQAIYEFTGADGVFLKDFVKNNNAIEYPLNKNYRSLKELVDISNVISGNQTKAKRCVAKEGQGGFFTRYEKDSPQELVDNFVEKIETLNLPIDNCAVLYRGVAGIEKLRSSSGKLGQGKVALLAKACIFRDAHIDYHSAYELVLGCVMGLLSDAPDDLNSRMNDVDLYPEVKEFRSHVWRFVKDKELGLPSSSLKAESEWLVKLKENIAVLFNEIENSCGYQVTSRLGNNLTKAKLLDEPLLKDKDLIGTKKKPVRVDTVHQAKGESLDGVLYVATKAHIESMLAGVETEDGRIGYVALTRAKDVFVLGVPNAAYNELKSRLEAIGLSELN